jgi:hypothetical protein
MASVTCDVLRTDAVLRRTRAPRPRPRHGTPPCPHFLSRRIAHIAQHVSLRRLLSPAALAISPPRIRTPTTCSQPSRSQPSHARCCFVERSVLLLPMLALACPPRSRSITLPLA